MPLSAAVGPEAADEGQPALVADAVGARLLKRLVQAHATFAGLLLPRLAGQLAAWAKRGAGWVVLALLEHASTGGAVRAELKGAANALGKSGAAGCRTLADVLGGKGAPAAAAQEEEGGKKKKAKKAK